MPDARIDHGTAALKAVMLPTELLCTNWVVELKEL